jgi:hypothetical protein
MFRILIALLGLAVLGAIFAAIYYDPDNLEWKENGVPAFNPAPGEVRSYGIQPSLRGAPILVDVRVQHGTIDVYIMDKDWATTLPVPGENRLSLDRPFSYHAEHSALGVRDRFTTTIVSDGVTWHTLVIDNSDNLYNDTVPDEADGAAAVAVTSRYLAEEQRSLVLGYLAAVPSVLLVLVTLGRQFKRRRDEQGERQRKS